MGATASSLPESPKSLELVPLKQSGHGLLILIFFLAISFITIGWDKPPAPLSKETPATEFSAERAMAYLAVVARAPHPTGSAEHDTVRDYITHTLQNAGLEPQVQTVTDINQTFGMVDKLENIVCRLKGKGAGKAVLLVAHYDSVAAGPGASDDGVAVSGLLETARALKNLPQLGRDIIFLFTDGEESNLLGARAFISSHPWAQDVGVVLNFEARGNSGPSIMFETSDGNGWLIDNFARAASHPVANSLSYEIYKYMPNTTDFNAFRRAGYPGLNFAFIKGLEYYHTPLDTISHVNPGSLQHQGDYLLEMAKQFGNVASDIPKVKNDVYFDVLGIFLVRYSQSAGMVFLSIAALLTGFILYLGFNRQYLSVGACVMGLFSMIAGIAITASGVWLVPWITFQMQHIARIHAGLHYHSAWYILSASFVGLAAGLAFYTWISKIIGATNLVAGTFVGWLGAAILISFYFPGGSYLFLWPLLFSLIGGVIIFGRSTVVNTKSPVVMLSAIPAIVLLISIVHKIYWAFAAQSGIIVGALLGLLLSMLAAAITVEHRSRRWRLPMLLVTAGAGLFITAIAISGA